MTPASLRRRWFLLSCFAGMNVASSGGRGPACRPYVHALQLLVERQTKRHESWTIYRNEEEPLQAGKIVYKNWDFKSDWIKLQKFDGKPLPKDWHEDAKIVEREFPASSRWLRGLDRALFAISIPPITGPVAYRSRGICYKLSLWRGGKEAKFSWHQKSPEAWVPLADFFSSLWDLLETHAAGGPLPPVK